MKEVNIEAYGKINLALDVLGRLPNGYHEVRMIMQQVALCDQVHLRILEGKREIRLQSNRDDVPEGRENIAYRAAEWMMDMYEIVDGVEIYIDKQIPMAAGLAGGSADGAAVLQGMNILFGLNLRMRELLRIGAELGADVPFCLLGGAAMAGGTGINVTSIKGMDAEKVTLLLCKPDVSVATKDVYEEYSRRMGEMITRPHPDVVRLVADLTINAPLADMKKNMINVLEYITGEQVLEIEEIEAVMEEEGAAVSKMTGSGPTVFGIFESRENAKSAYERLIPRFPQTFLTTFR